MTYYLPKGLRVPGVCKGCAAPVTYDGKRWTDRPGRRHSCPRARCGVWMPTAQARCARPPGIHNRHRSLYALDNARVHRARGVSAA